MAAVAVRCRGSFTLRIHRWKSRSARWSFRGAPGASTRTARRWWTAACGLATCSSWSAATAGRRRCSGSGVGRGDRVASSRPIPMRMLEQFYAVPQMGAILVPLNYRLTAADFHYMIEHCEPPWYACTRTIIEAVEGHPGAAAERRALRGARGWPRRVARLRGDAGGCPAGFRATADRRRRRDHDQLHQRHHLAAQGRDDHASQRLDELRRHPGALSAWRSASAICGRCRCSMPTAGPSCGP